VSDFANGSDFEPCKYHDIEALKWSYYQSLVDGDSTKYRRIAWDKHKPDYTMTNAGLHIHLPMHSLPAVFDGKFSHTRDDDSDLYKSLSFAFLACKSRKQKALVVVCLYRNDGPNHLDYSRATFNGKMLHVLDGSTYGTDSLLFTKFEPVWIRQAQFSNYIYHPPQFSGLAERIQFELWWKSKTPLVFRWSGTLEEDNQVTMQGAAQQLHASGQEIPPIFKDAQQPLQLCIKGELPATQLAHEVIAVQGNLNTFDERYEYAAIGFGVADRCLWLKSLTMKGAIDVPSLCRGLSFPTGRSWYNSDPAICVSHDSQGSFTLERTMHNPAFYGEYLVHVEHAEVVLFKIYFSSV
jgi:hypothetical protein